MRFACLLSAISGQVRSHKRIGQKPFVTAGVDIPNHLATPQSPERNHAVVANATAFAEDVSENLHQLKVIFGLRPNHSAAPP